MILQSGDYNMENTISQTGVIERIELNKVYVKIMQQSACAECHAKSMCRSSECKDRIVEIEGLYNSFQVHEEVEIHGRSSLGYWAIFYAFVLPILLILAVVILFSESNRSDTVTALAGLAVLPLYYSVLYVLRDRLKRKFVFTMKKLN